MEKLKKYGNSIWRVPLIAVIAGFLYAPIYTRIVLGFGIIQPGVIDKGYRCLQARELLWQF